MTTVYVEAEPGFRARLADELRERSFTVKSVAAVSSADAAGPVGQASWAVLDLRFPGPVGRLLARALGWNPEVKIALVTGHSSIASALEASPVGRQDAAAAEIESRGILMLPGPPPIDVDAIWTLGVTTREHVRRVLAYCGGNISEAARRLGLTRRALQIRLRKYQTRNDDLA